MLYRSGNTGEGLARFGKGLALLVKFVVAGIKEGQCLVDLSCAQRFHDGTG
jgi:hypothetical protein